jgi:beta-lactamase class A
VTAAPAVHRDIARAFGRAQVSGWLHVVDIDGDDEVALGADEPVALASVFKLPVLVALYRAADAGRLDLTERIHLAAADRTPGVTGLATLHDDAELSLRDLAKLMITVSDNAAADAVLDRLGIAAVARTIDELGLRRTAVEHSCRATHRTWPMTSAARRSAWPRLWPIPRCWPACGCSTRRPPTAAPPAT